MASIEITEENPINVSLGEENTLTSSVSSPETVSVTSTDGWYEKKYEETDPIFEKSPASDITNEDIENWNNKSNFSGDYNDLENKPTIPTKISQLTNDSGFLTEHQDISGKVDKETGKGLSTNDFTNAYKSNVDRNTTARHTHSNKSVLDSISSTDITNWNNKLDTSDLTDYVNNTDYATKNTGGVVKIDSAYGLKVNSSGTLYTSNENYSTYSNANNNFTISKGTLENVITGKQLTNQTDLSAKQDNLVSGTNIKTINNQSILGSGNITIQGGGGTGSGDMLKSVYDTDDDGIVDNAELVNGHTVAKDVPSNAVFTDTVYDDTEIRNTLSQKANSSDIPTKTSDINNDSGFITNSYHDSTKQDTLVSGTNIKTINGNSILGNGDITINSDDIDSYQLGTNGYIRYKNGLQFAWVEKYLSITMSVWGSIYYYDVSNLPNWEKPFTEVYQQHITCNNKQFWFGCDDGTTTTAPGIVRIYRPTSGTYNIVLRIIAIGKWK